MVPLRGNVNKTAAERGRDKSTNEGKADGGAAKYTAEQRGADKSTVELKAQGARTATVNGAKVTVPEAVWQGSQAPTADQSAAMLQRREDSASGGTKGDRKKKVVGGGQTSGNRRDSEVPFTSRLQDVPGVALICDGCGDDWCHFPRSRGVARGCVDEEKAVVTVMQEKHKKCKKQCKPAKGATVRIGGVEYTVKSAQDG